MEEQYDHQLGDDRKQGHNQIAVGGASSPVLVDAEVAAVGHGLHKGSHRLQDNHGRDLAVDANGDMRHGLERKLALVMRQG